jgi:MFS superfamily sulfate permease-like transporter
MSSEPIKRLHKSYTFRDDNEKRDKKGGRGMGSGGVWAAASAFAVDVAAGIAASLLQFVFCASYAAGVFYIPRSHHLVGVGVMMTAIAMILTQPMYGWNSKIAYTFVAPEAFYIPLLGAISVDLSNRIDDDSVYENTFIFVNVLTVFITGFLKWLAGRFGLLKLCDYIPYPVICGLMGSVGINLFDLSIMLSTQYKLAYAWNFLPTALVALASILGHQFYLNPAMTFGALVVLGISIFYIVIISFHIPMETVEQGNWVFGKQTAVSRYWSYVTSEIPAVFQYVDWNAVIAVLPQVFGISVIVLLKISLCIPPYEKVLRIKVNKSDEMSIYGIATMISAVFGAAGTSPALSILTLVGASA